MFNLTLKNFFLTFSLLNHVIKKKFFGQFCREKKFVHENLDHAPPPPPQMINGRPFMAAQPHTNFADHIVTVSATRLNYWS